MQDATVSVVTPAYNSAEHLTHAIESVSLQRRRVLSHIVIDDGSSDRTRELMSELQERHPHLIYMRQCRAGAAKARNLGIEAAEGRYVAFLDSDDLWLPGKLDAQIHFMESRGVAFSYGDYQVRRRDSDDFVMEYRSPERVDHAALLRGCPIGCLTVAYDQRALGKVYMPDVRRGQDWGMWLSLARLAGEGRKYPGTHAIYHSGGGSLSANKLAKMRDIYRIYREQEGLDSWRSSWYLLHHSLNAIRKF